MVVFVAGTDLLSVTPKVSAKQPAFEAQVRTDPKPYNKRLYAHAHKHVKRPARVTLYAIRSQGQLFTRGSGISRGQHSTLLDTVFTYLPYSYSLFFSYSVQ